MTRVDKIVMGSAAASSRMKAGWACHLARWIACTYCCVCLYLLFISPAVAIDSGVSQPAGAEGAGSLNSVRLVSSAEGEGVGVSRQNSAQLASGTTFAPARRVGGSLRGAIGVPRGSVSQVEAGQDHVPRSVELPLGKVMGTPCDQDSTVTKYYGIPFAEPPLDDLRFRPPRKYSRPYPANGLDATSAPPPCGSQCSGNTWQDSASSEDCLFLNLWVPAGAAAPGQAKLPVRVYLHGGALTECSASDRQWDGCQASLKTGTIQVNVQFRLGAFGMLAHPTTMDESNTTGNWGLLDQQLALRWVRDHIEYFGGDPSQVLLNGHSRGGQMVDFHMVAPGSAGLFAAAISQSPACSHFRTLEEAYADTSEFMKMAGCAPLATPAAELACMRRLPWTAAMALARTMDDGRGVDVLLCDRHAWHPVLHHAVDGTVVPYQLLEALAKGKFNKVPYMTGFTTNEAGGFLSTSKEPVTESTIVDFISTMFPGADPQPILDTYPLELYKDAPSPTKARLSSIWSDALFTCPIHQRLVARAAHEDAPTFLYLWGVTPSCPPDMAFLGPTHGTDLWYTFGIVSNFTSPGTGACDFSEDEDEVSRRMLHAYMAMASTGVPRWPNGTGWAKYDPRNELGTYINTGIYRTDRIDFSDRCTKLLDAKVVPGFQGNNNAPAP